MVVKEFDVGRFPKKVRQDVYHEASVLNALDHPNIVAYYDTYEDRVSEEARRRRESVRNKRSSKLCGFSNVPSLLLSSRRSL